MLNSIRGRSWGVILGCALLVTITTFLSPFRATAQEPARDTTCLKLSDSASKSPENVRLKSELRNCAQRADSTRRALAIESASAAARPTYDVFFTVPEAGDEQRLDDGSGTGNLGPVAFIFPSPFANGFTRRRQIAAHSLPGLLVAVVVVDGVPGTPVPRSYDNLRLQTGVNCIWLFATDPNPAHDYQVFVTSTPPGSPCDRSSARRGPLFVNESHAVGFGHADYAPSARFDEVSNQPLLGFKCLAAFCEAGPSNFAQQPPPVSVPELRGKKEGQIKAWFDEQYLSERVGGFWKKIVPAVLFPVPDLDQLDRSDFTTDYRLVGWLYILGPIPPGSKYAQWGLSVGPNRRNTVELKLLDPTTSKWSMRITPSGGAPKIWTDVEEMPHPDVPIPGAVRFRFTVADDGIWVPCGQSCCRANGS